MGADAGGSKGCRSLVGTELGGTGLLPAGDLFIEGSVDKKPSGKAQRDFDKRALEVRGSGSGKSEGTFLFVTARRWSGADAWARRMKKAG